jgi:anti-sigma regulatory factor (Ser/Thr protein kinase)
MAIVELRFSALPEHVRTARLVSAAVARRAGVAETVLDEVRLAVGEACSRAVGISQEVGGDQPVAVFLDESAGRFSVEVHDNIPQPDGGAGWSASAAEASVNGSGSPSVATIDLAEADMGLAVILGLVDDLDVRTGGDGSVIRMSWPAKPVTA